MRQFDPALDIKYCKLFYNLLLHYAINVCSKGGSSSDMMFKLVRTNWYFQDKEKDTVSVMYAFIE